MEVTAVECRFVCGDFDYRELDRLKAEGWKVSDVRLSKDGWSLHFSLYRNETSKNENISKKQQK